MFLVDDAVGGCVLEESCDGVAVLGPLDPRVEGIFHGSEECDDVRVEAKQCPHLDGVEKFWPSEERLEIGFLVDRYAECELNFSSGKQMNEYT